MLDSPADERMDTFIAVFNGHKNKADERARAELSKRQLASLRRIERRGGGIMAIFDQPPTDATRRYADLVTQFVNE